MSTIKETFQVTLKSSIGRVKRMELTIQTYGEGAQEAMRLTQAILDEASSSTDDLKITNIERITE